MDKQGKRSDPDWVRRAFYVRANTDSSLDITISMLKAQGINIDKSQLTDELLSEWLRQEPDEQRNWLKSKFDL